MTKALPDNTCLIQLLNNYHLTVVDTASLLGCSYQRARGLTINLRYDILEAYTIANHLKIPIDDFCKILLNDKETLKKYLLKT